MTEIGSRTVAVVDDDLAVLESFQFLLEMAGFPVAAYPSALAFLDAGRIRPRCLIVDHNMPAMTGLELAARLRADGLDIPFMLVTSILSPDIVAKARAIGVREVLAKPPPEVDVIAFIQACDPG